MPKQKSHKGVLKRVKVTGRGKVKSRKAFAGHLMSHKSGEFEQKLRKDRLTKRGDIKRLSRLLHRPLKAANTGENRQRAEAGKA